MATLEIEARGSAILTIFYPIDVMFGKVKPEPSTELNNTTNHPEYVWGTLVETYLKCLSKLVRSLLIGILTTPSTKENKGTITVSSPS